MKRLFLLSVTALLLASCGGEAASTSRFIPPSDPSSSRSSGSVSYSGSLPMETAEERASKIIADQANLTEYYNDYKMTLEKVDDTTSTSLYIYSPINLFYATKNATTETYLVTIDGVQTLITVQDGETTSSTDESVIALSATAFRFGVIIKELAFDILEGAFDPEKTVTLMDASIDENDSFIMTVDTGTFLTSFYAVVDMTFSSTSLLSNMTMKITQGTYAGNHVSFSFVYGTSEEDRQYPAI